MKLLSGLFALILLLAACAADGGDATETGGSADDDTAGASDAEAGDAEADASTGESDSGEADDSSDGSSDGGDGADASADDGSSAGDASDGSDASSAGDDDSDTDGSEDDGTTDGDDDESAGGGQDPGAIGPFLSAFFLETGVEPTDEVLDCLTDRDIDLDLGIVSNESDLLEPTLALMACAPDELAANLARDVTPPPGTSADDVECVISQTFRYMGELPPDVAQAGLAADNVPEQFRADLTPIVQNVCDLSAEQAEAIFDS